MADHTAIEWTDASWNPVTGCTKVSPGCDHCYAETIARRFADTPAYPHGFASTLRPERLDLPLRWTRPRRIFVNSMSDLFHDAVPDGYIARVWATMAAARQHTFQVLTKRHARLRSLLSSPSFTDLMAAAWFDLPRNRRPGNAIEWPLPNVWVGISAENQQWADIRIPALLDTPAAVRWISAEPLIGRIDLHSIPSGLRMDGGPRRDSALVAPCPLCSGWGGGECPDGPHFVKLPGGIDWVVVGGESGRGARPMHQDWARDIRDQCAAAGVPFLMKQAGVVLAREWGAKGKGGDPAEWPEPFPRQYPRELTPAATS